MNADQIHFHSITRRSFLKQGSSAVGLTVLGGLALERGVHAANDDTIKIALIGCGGRGSGAANQALTTGNVRLVAMADAFMDRINASIKNLQKLHPGKVKVPVEHRFTGLEGYKQAIALADVVIIAAPPGFRPAHYEEAVRQGKHVFMEKPLATDAPGIRQILAANEEAKKKNLKVGVGFQRHHEAPYLETVKRIQDGAIGDIVSMRCYWRGGSRGGLPRENGESELEYQLRNWYFYTWLSGDHIVEQHCHNIDVCNWIKGAHPIRAHGIGGRQVRTTKEHGQIFDHFYVEFEYADGVRMHSESSQIPHLWTTVSEHVAGSKGMANLISGRGFDIRPKGGTPWRYPGNEGKKDAYQNEHDALFAAVRENKTFNETESSALSTMTAIMGRMAAYSGQLVEWDEAFNSTLELVPRQLAWNDTPPVVPDENGFYPVAVPGKTKAL